MTELAKLIAFDSPQAICWPNDRAHVRLVRRAGPHRHRAHALVGEHLPRRLRGPLGLDRPVLPAALVDAADVEAGRHRDARAERRQPLGELERRVAEINGAVDVRLRDVHQLGGAVDVRPSARGSTSPAPAPVRTSPFGHRPIAIAQIQHAPLTIMRRMLLRRFVARLRDRSSPCRSSSPRSSAPRPEANDTVTILKPARVFDGETMHEGWVGAGERRAHRRRRPRRRRAPPARR